MTEHDPTSAELNALRAQVAALQQQLQTSSAADSPAADQMALNQQPGLSFILRRTRQDRWEIAACGGGLLQQLGQRAADVLGRDPREVWPNQPQEATRRCYQRAFHGENVSFEAAAADGRLSVLYQLRPLAPEVSAGEGLRQIIGTAIEVSANRRVEDGLRDQLLLYHAVAKCSQLLAQTEPASLPPAGALLPLAHALEAESVSLWRWVPSPSETDAGREIWLQQELVVSPGNQPVESANPIIMRLPAQDEAVRRLLAGDMIAWLPTARPSAEASQQQPGPEEPLRLVLIGSAPRPWGCLAVQAATLAKPLPSGSALGLSMAANLFDSWLQRAAATQQLVRQERFHRSLIENAIEGILLYDPQGRITYASPACEAILGYQPEELVGRSAKELLAPVDQATVRRAWYQVLEQPGRSLRLPHRVRHAHGHTVWLEARVTNLLHDPAVAAVVSNYHDITSRQETEEQLAHRNRLLTEMGRLARIGAWEYDSQTQHLEWSPEVYEIHHLPVGTPLDVEMAISYYAAEAQPVIRQAVAECLASGKPFDLQLPFYSANQKRLWVRAGGQRLADQPHRIFGCFQDITQQKANEDALAKALDAAEQSSRAKSAFLANISHEIRTPMNGILGLIDLTLGESRLPAESQERLLMARESAQQLLNVLSDLLDLAELGAQRLPLRYETFSLRPLLDELAASYQAAAAERGLKFASTIGPEVPDHWHGDPARLRQVLINLLDNAVKFTSEGGIHFKAVWAAGEDAGLLLEVGDTGPGIPPERRERIFAPFEQLDVSNTRSHGGTGMGLALCHGLAALMGGWITVDSHSGSGSTFRVFLPNASSQWQPASPRSEPRTDPAEPASRLRLLALESNRTGRLALTQSLGNLGFKVTLAEHAREAWQAWLQGTWDAVLLDLKATTLALDGKTIVEYIREAERGHDRPRTALIGLVTRLQLESLESYFAKGLDAWLVKPLAAGAATQLFESIANAELLDHVNQQLAQLPNLGTFDWLRERLGDEEDFIVEMLSSVREDASTAVEKLAPLMARSHWTEVSQQAHALVGACRTVGAVRLATAARRIEQLCQDGQPHLARRVWPALLNAYRALLRTIDLHWPGPPG